MLFLCGSTAVWVGVAGAGCVFEACMAQWMADKEASASQGSSADGGDAEGPEPALPTVGEGAPKAQARSTKRRKKNPPEEFPHPSPCGLMTNVDHRSSKWLAHKADCYRDAVPGHLANHPVFAAFMKFDQTLYRECNNRFMRREVSSGLWGLGS